MMHQYIYLLSPTTAWVVSQAIKLSLERLSHKRVVFNDIMSSGNMPSSHVSGSMALLTVVGSTQGVQSAIFGLGFVVTVLVAYDSLGVRRTAAESALAIRQINTKLKLDLKPPHIYKGHTPIEVAAGAILGLVVGELLAHLL